ncbi:hypothetical protein KDA_48820 [Dictyobacter alpinus]|uniref:Uncharacterized protein n=1 Tax=Dictyobacter alpinus TaxID=2014873 RepID=A0A402BDB7_9CHLR|nr:hypothetical protein [Dictyobacter alpinus]GCE29398.1 hypothetical protein KDA_48820 [Dictyobacter alpinus]
MSGQTAITAHATDDIWVIGQDKEGPKTLHWDGKKWNAPTIQTTSSGAITLSDIAVIVPDNAWIVGSSQTGKDTDAVYQPILLHWDGSTWSDQVCIPESKQQMARPV